MNKRDQHLENCLTRLAAGESVANCLADYPQDADWLQPLLTTAQQLHTLPARQPRPAADLSIQQQLRQAAQQSNAASSPPLPIHFVEDPMKNMSRFLLRWLPRVLVGGTAVALLIVFIAQFADPLAFFSSQDTEPAVEPLPANVTTIGDTTITLEANLSPDASEAPLYRARLEPVPTTVAEAVAWAKAFGLSDPEPYRPFNENDPSIIVLGSDGQRLSFQDFGPFREVSYAHSTASLLTHIVASAPLPFDEAADIAVAFLRDHDFLPDEYQVEPAIGSSGLIQQVVVRPQVKGGIIGDDTSPGTALRVQVDAAGQVISASLSRLVLEADGTIPIISAQAAYDDLLNNRNVVRSTYSTAVGSSAENSRSYQPPLPTWTVGQTVDLIGYLTTLVHAETDALHIELTGPDQANYHLTGSDLADLSEQIYRGAVRIQGTITAQDSPSSWQVEVTDWQAISPDDFNTPCLIGSLAGTGHAARFRSQAGDEYDLPQAPTDIAVGEVIEVCAAPAEPGEALAWYNIHVPPRGDGPPPGGMVTEQRVVEEMVEVAVTRVIVEEVGGSGIAPAVPLPQPTAVMPVNPYEIGDEVTLTGMVQVIRIVAEDGEERLEATFINDGEQGEAPYPYSYPLVAEQALLAEMAAFNNLHIRVNGRIVAPPEDPFIEYVTGHEQALAVDSFDRPWPDEKIEQFLGHFSLEELEGRPRLVFTDHATDQQYVINPPDLPPEAYERDDSLQEAQILLAGVVHPVRTFAGLPLLDRRTVGTGPEIAQATDVSQFPLPEVDYDDIPTLNEADMRRHDEGVAGVLHGEVIIERVALVYLYQQQHSTPSLDDRDSTPDWQLLQPVWAFYGRSADGHDQFVIQVRAVRE